MNDTFEEEMTRQQNTAEETASAEAEQSVEEAVFNVGPSPDEAAADAAFAGAAGKKERKRSRGMKVVALVLCCVVIGGLAGLGGSALGNRLFSDSGSAQGSTLLEGSRTAAPLNVSHVDTSAEMTAAEVYAANVNSTVGITTETTINIFGYQTVSAAAGSGFIITSDGYILTNYHVIEDSGSVTVSTYDGTSYDAEVIGYDENNDIAVLKIDAEGLTPVIIGDSDNLNVGDDVIAIGNPLGELTFSLTKGVVSALDREVTLSSSVTMDLIQTDCAINSGNSGGPLFDMYGEVVGITNAKYSSSGSISEASVDNIGFAIPINQVADIVTSIIENGYIAKPYIGVTVKSVDTDSQSLGLPAGAAVYSVTEDSPAEDAGLMENDIITAVDGAEIADSSELVDIVGEAAPGDVLTLTVYRQGQTLEIEITVGENIQSALADEDEDEQEAVSSEEMYRMFGFGY